MDNILKAIDKKAEEEIVKILQEKEEALLRLEEEYFQKIEVEQKKQKKEIESRATKEIEEFEKSWQIKLNFQVQEMKNEIIKEVYEKARRKITAGLMINLLRLILGQKALPN